MLLDFCCSCECAGKFSTAVSHACSGPATPPSRGRTPSHNWHGGVTGTATKVLLFLGSSVGHAWQLGTGGFDWRQMVQRNVWARTHSISLQVQARARARARRGHGPIQYLASSRVRCLALQQHYAAHACCVGAAIYRHTL